MKFKLRQKVWVLRDNKAIQAMVVARRLDENVRLTEARSPSIKPECFDVRHIEYRLALLNDNNSWLTYNEEQVFATKEELIASL